MLTKTNNSFLAEKIRVRLHSLSQINRPTLRILEAYRGESLLWPEVQKHTDKKIELVGIDIKGDYKGAYLKGDNVKFLLSMNLDGYDIIDLDAYGVPYQQLKAIIQKGYSGVVHCTFIQSMYGGLPRGMLGQLGYSHAMVRKIPTLFIRDGVEKFKQFLSLYGVNKITGYFIGRKNYFYFALNS
jgi:hypothetical protein